MTTSSARLHSVYSPASASDALVFKVATEPDELEQVHRL